MAELKNQNKILKRIIFLGIISVFLLLLVFEPVQLLILKIASKMLGESLSISEWGSVIKSFSISLIFGLFILLPSNLELKKNQGILQSAQSEKNQKIHLYGFFISICFVGIALCSTTSFLYAFHDYDDAHCFFTVGKSVLYGKVPYRDIYEQKGPVLYFLHTFASLISSKSFIGVYFLQLLSNFFFIFYAYKILILFISESSARNILPVIFAIIVSSNNYICGDTVEELSFALVMIPLYFSIKNLKLNQDFSKKEMFVCGIFAGIIFWMKYTLIGFFIGWAIIPVYCYIKNKKIKELFNCILFLILGVLAVTLPVFIYFIANNALTDLFQVYFIDNIFSYAKKPVGTNPFLYKIFFLILSFGKMCIQNPFDTILLIFTIISVLKSNWKKEIKLHLLICYLASFLFIYIGGVRFAYYSLILSIFLIFSAPVFDNFLSYIKISPKIASIISFVLSIVIIFSFSNQWKFLGKKKENYPQYQMAQIIKQYETSDYKPTLLNYGKLDFGLYFLTDIIPSEKYFAKLNVHSEQMYSQMESCIKEKRVDFITTYFKENCDSILSYDTYDLIYSKDDYYLFKKK